MTPQEASAKPGNFQSELPHALALRVLTQGVTDGITILDASGRLVYANEVAAISAGYATAEEMISNPEEWKERIEFQDALGRPVDLSDFPGRRVLRGERPEPLLVKVVERATGSARWSSVSAEPYHGPDGSLQYVVDTVQDVTDRVVAEAETRRLVANQTFLVHAAKKLSATLDFEPTLQRIADLLVSRLTDWCVIDLLEPDGSLRAAVVAHADPAKLAPKAPGASGPGIGATDRPNPVDGEGVVRVERRGAGWRRSRRHERRLSWDRRQRTAPLRESLPPVGGNGLVGRG